MRYRKLGSSGLIVSEVCLGTMTFGGRGYWSSIGNLDQSAADRLVARALDAGVNFIDTADVYSDGLSEEITGRAIASSGHKRSDVVLATKVYGAVGTAPNDSGASRGHIMDAVKGSLKRLGTDYIDLYQIHGFDPVTPIEETLRAMEDGALHLILVKGKGVVAGRHGLGFGGRRVGLGDLDGDGALDVVAAGDYDKSIVVLLNECK